jgi:hypothetical protein
MAEPPKIWRLCERTVDELGLGQHSLLCLLGCRSVGFVTGFTDCTGAVVMCTLECRRFDIQRRGSTHGKSKKEVVGKKTISEKIQY